MVQVRVWLTDRVLHYPVVVAVEVVDLGVADTVRTVLDVRVDLQVEELPRQLADRLAYKLCGGDHGFVPVLHQRGGVLLRVHPTRGYLGRVQGILGQHTPCKT